MKFSIHIHNFGLFSDPRVIGQLAKAADDAGWEAVFVADHLQSHWQGEQKPIADPWVAMTVIAMSTTRCKFGPMVTPLSRRRPWQLTSEIVTLDRLSNGRLILGVGSGTGISSSFTPFNEEPDARRRAELMEESLDIMTGFWTGEPVTYAGQHFNVDNARFLPTPVQKPRVPIWVAGHWPHKRPFRRAAHWDGVFIDGPGVDWMKGEIISQQDFRDSMGYTLDHRRELGITGPFDVVIGGHTPNMDRAAESLKPYADLGATWWVEAIMEGFHGVDEALALIRRGPPRL
ncbi:MAG: LLM class flavin-dependent oxidoreductase [Chloroflexota bacterium]|nr:MAG: LLM class flavin-dependent oxidoreductase [Chloroflexota bacterium]